MYQVLLGLLALLVATQIAFTNAQTAARAYLVMLQAEIETEAIGVAISALDSLRYVPFDNLEDAEDAPWTAQVVGGALGDTLTFNLAATTAYRRLNAAGDGYLPGSASDDFREVTIQVSHDQMTGVLEMKQIYARD